MLMVVRIFVVLVLLPIVASSQAVEVKKESSRIEGANFDGYQVAFAAPEDEVKSSLSRYLKTLGKTRGSGDYTTITAPLIAGKQYAGILYATTKQIANTTAAWFGAPAEQAEKSLSDQDLEKLVYDFGVAFHREKIQVQVDESLRALQTVEKQQQRLVNQNRDLITRIENNKREKVELEKSLVENKLELDDLTRRLAANTKAQDSVAIATSQIKKVVEMHKEKQRGIK